MEVVGGGREDVAIARWDGEDASYCTINNPVKLCVAKAGSAAAAAAAALSSLLTPSSLLSPSPTPSSPSLAATEGARTGGGDGGRRYSRTAMLNV